MKRWVKRRHALPKAAFVELQRALLDSPLVGRSTLAGAFRASRGFAVIFRHEGLGRLTEQFPSLRPYLDLTLGRPAVRAMTPFWTRTLERLPNAWYLNVLLVNEGGEVARHVDATLRQPAQVDDALPELVSVLYVSVPDAHGGELLLAKDDTLVGVIEPHENVQVHFRGDLAHQVRPFVGPGLRASLVIEQYHFAPEALARLPTYQLDSRAGFDAYLAHHRAAFDPARFEVDR